MGIADKLGFGKINTRVINSPVRLVGKGTWKDGKTTASLVEFADGTVIKGCSFNDTVGTYLTDERAIRFLVNGRKITSVLLNDGKVIEKPQHAGPALTAVAILIAGVLASLFVVLIPFGVAVVPFIMLYAIIQAFHAPKLVRAHADVLKEFYQN